MKKLMIALVGLTLTGGLAAAPGLAASAEDAETQLRQQNTQHQRALRQAVRVCAHHPNPTFSRFNHANVCVIGEMERYVASDDGAPVRAFHQKLPWRYRYDEARSFGEVQRFFN